MSNSTIQTTPFSVKDIRSVANIHHECINLGFLSQLGPGFLFYLYKSIDECNDTVLIIISDNDNVIGFITGATSGLRSVFSHLLKKHLIKILLVLLPHLFSFSKLKRIAEIILHTNENKSNNPNAELLSLAIQKNYRGSGAAKELFEQLVRDFQNKDIKDFKIIVGEKLGAAHSFYRKMGATEIDTIRVHDTSNSTVYKVSI